MNADHATARALWYVAPGRVEIQDATLGALAPGMARVRARFGAVSRGTEAVILAGGVPVSEYERMRAPFMAGRFPFPVKYGYANVGRVEAGPAELVGQTVFTLYPHQTLFDVPSTAALPLPATVPARRAVLAANMETALNALWDLRPRAGQRIAVVGAGVLGSLVGHLCAASGGADVTLVDIDRDKAHIAGALGLKFAAPEAAMAECDAVIHTSASAAGLETALNLAGDEATILELSWYGAKRIDVALGGAFHSRRLKLVSSQVGKVSPSHRATVSHRQRLAMAIDLLADARLDVLLGPAIRFADLPERLPAVLAPGQGTLAPVVDYS